MVSFLLTFQTKGGRAKRGRLEIRTNHLPPLSHFLVSPGSSLYVRPLLPFAGAPRSNFETLEWKRRVTPEPGTIFAGVTDYFALLFRAAASRIITDAQVAWRALHRTIV